MKLLIITQKVDKNDDILGFFHDWLLEFADRYEKVTVICLGKGQYTLPKNVRVLSLGKEAMGKLNFVTKFLAKFTYIANFYNYIIDEEENYDKVFVHMNPEYVVLGGLFWRYWRKEVFLWYNHKIGSLKTRIAILFSEKVFHTSSLAFPAKFKKSQIMPAGINTRLFVPKKSVSKKGKTVLSLGRISPVKKLEVLIKALKVLDKNGVKFNSGIYGGCLKQDLDYYKNLKKIAIPLEEKGILSFHNSVSNYQTPEVYNQYQIFVNLTQSGSFDKTILEAMTCGNIVLVSNKSFKNILSDQFLFKENNSRDLARKLEGILKLPASSLEKHSETFRQYVIKNHDIKTLVSEIKTHLS